MWVNNFHAPILKRTKENNYVHWVIIGQFNIIQFKSQLRSRKFVCRTNTCTRCASGIPEYWNTKMHQGQVINHLCSSVDLNVILYRWNLLRNVFSGNGVLFVFRREDYYILKLKDCMQNTTAVCNQRQNSVRDKFSLRQNSVWDKISPRQNWVWKKISDH